MLLVEELKIVVIIRWIGVWDLVVMRKEDFEIVVVWKDGGGSVWVGCVWGRFFKSLCIGGYNLGVWVDFGRFNGYWFLGFYWFGFGLIFFLLMVGDLEGFVFFERGVEE